LAARPPVRLAAVVLAGGQARRLGGTDKPLIEVGGRSLACAVIGAAAEAGAERVILVGPERPGLTDELARAGLGDRVELTSERPAGGGPVPALRAGIELLANSGLPPGSELPGGSELPPGSELPGGGAGLVLLLAADLPFLTGTLLRSLTAAADGAGAGEGVVAVDETGRHQWLTSCWRVSPLRAALAGYEGDSLRGLLAPLGASLLEIAGEPGEPPFWLDCDSPQDVAMARRWGGRRGPGAQL
jgi:molybdopterin-guanine dinucleotide biosynthesis protein A